jgi:hypothetical protein
MMPLPSEWMNSLIAQKEPYQPAELERLSVKQVPGRSRRSVRDPLSSVFLASFAALRETILDLPPTTGFGCSPPAPWNEEKRLKEKALASDCPTLDIGRITVTDLEPFI